MRLKFYCPKGPSNKIPSEPMLTQFTVAYNMRHLEEQNGSYFANAFKCIFLE